MNIKKIFITALIIFSLNFSPLPVTIYIRERNTVLMIQNKKKGEIMDDFTREIENKRFDQMISLYFSLMMIEFETKNFKSA